MSDEFDDNEQKGWKEHWPMYAVVRTEGMEAGWGGGSEGIAVAGRDQVCCTGSNLIR